MAEAYAPGEGNWRRAGQELPEPGSLGAFIIATRPRTLPASIAPVLVGWAIAWADGTFSFLPALAALCAAICIQIGTNLANDLYDYLRGTDTSERLGPPRAGQTGLLTPNQLRLAMAGAFLLATLLGLYLVLRGGWLLAVAGALAIGAGIAYTAGPFPLGYLGLGDILVLIFFGPVAVIGTYYVQALRISPEAALASIPVGLLTTAILVVNDVRDIKSDARAGKKTLPVRFGVKFGRAEYASLILISYLWLPVMAYATSNPWLILPSLSFPRGLSLVRAFSRTEPGPELNSILASSAQLLLLYSVILGIAFIAGR